jgi:hypothetical protein
MSKLETNTIDTISGSTNLTLGGTNATDITIPSGVTITNNGTQSGFGGTNTPAFQVLRNAAQSIPNSTFTKVQLNTELIDTDSAFDNSTNYRFTVPSGKDGNYLFSYGIQFLTFNAVRCLARIEKNGTEIHAAEINDHTSSDNASINASVMLPLVATDYIELLVYQNSGSSQNIRGSSTEAFTYLSGFKLI